MTTSLKKLLAISLIASSATGQLLAPPKGDKKGGSKENSALEGVIDWEAEYRKLQSSQNQEQPYAHPTAVTRTADTTLDNPFKKTNYFSDQDVIIYLDLGEYRVTFNCGKGGSGDIKAALDPVQMSVTKGTSLRIKRPSLQKGFKLPSVESIQKALTDEFLDNFPMIKDLAPLLIELSSGKLSEELPPGANLFFRTMILLNSELDKTSIMSELFTLICRYKLTLVSSPSQKQAATGRISETALKLWNACFGEKKKEVQKEQEPKRALVIVQKMEKAAQQAAHDEGYGWVWDFFSKDKHDITYSPKLLELQKTAIEKRKEARRADPIMQARKNKEAEAAETAAKKAEAQALQLQTNTEVAAQLTAKAFHNMHNSLAKHHTQLLDRDPAYKAECEDKEKKNRILLQFLNTQDGKTAKQRIDDKITELTEDYQPSDDDTTYLKEQLELQEKYCAFMVNEVKYINSMKRRIIERATDEMTRNTTPLIIQLEASVKQLEGLINSRDFQRKTSEEQIAILEQKLTQEKELQKAKKEQRSRRGQLPPRTEQHNLNELYESYAQLLADTLKKLMGQMSILRDCVTASEENNREMLDNNEAQVTACLNNLLPSPFDLISNPITSLEFTLADKRFEKIRKQWARDMCVIGKYVTKESADKKTRQLYPSVAFVLETLLTNWPSLSKITKEFTLQDQGSRNVIDLDDETALQ